MSPGSPKKYLITALVISLLVHIALVICLIYWGHLKLKKTDAPRLNIQFASLVDTPKQVIEESTPTPTTTDNKKTESDANNELSHNSSGWGMQREKKRNMSSDQKSQMESRIGFEKMQRQGKVQLSIPSIISSLQQQGIQVSCEIRLSEDFSSAKITCLPPAIEGYIQSLLGPANLRWEIDSGAKPICISIHSLGGTRGTCQ